MRLVPGVARAGAAGHFRRAAAGTTSTGGAAGHGVQRGHRGTSRGEIPEHAPLPGFGPSRAGSGDPGAAGDWSAMRTAIATADEPDLQRLELLRSFWDLLERLRSLGRR